MDESILEYALIGLESRRQELDEIISNLRSQLGHRGPGRPKATDGIGRTVPGRRVMSAEARERIAAAQRKRWAKVKGQTAVAAPAKPKRKLSAAGRKAIADAMRRRWAAKRKAA